MWMSGQLYALAALTQGENARYFLNRRLVRLQGWSGCFGEEKYFFLLLEFRL
jgi:hypothetical protein